MQIIITCNNWLSIQQIKKLEKVIENYLKESEGLQGEILFRFFDMYQKSTINKIEIILDNDILPWRDKASLLEKIQMTVEKEARHFNNRHQVLALARVGNFQSLEAEYRLIR